MYLNLNRGDYFQIIDRLPNDLNNKNVKRKTGRKHNILNIAAKLPKIRNAHKFNLHAKYGVILMEIQSIFYN